MIGYIARATVENRMERFDMYVLLYGVMLVPQLRIMILNCMTCIMRGCTCNVIAERYTCTRFSTFVFFSSKASSWSPDQDPKLFLNINSKSPRYLNSKVIPRMIRIRGKKLFCRATVGPNN